VLLKLQLFRTSWCRESNPRWLLCDGQ